jgi:beta-lactam-binding protein with PASTA domain
MNKVKKISENIIVRNLVFAMCAILVFVSVATVALNIFTRHNQYKKVPDFIGIELGEVEKMATKERLRIEVLDSVYAPIYDGGVVLEQQPTAGTEVKSGRRIFVTITSHGQKTVEVPYVTGFSLRQAKNMIEVAGLEIKELRYINNIATNNILAMLNGRDTIRRDSHLQLEVGSGVTLLVGRAEDAMPVEVPKIVGLSLGEAKSRLWERGLNVGKVSMDEDINLVNQRDAKVFSQLPSYSRMARLGDKVGFSITLDDEKITKGVNAADRDARQIILQRQAELQEAEADATQEEIVAQ